MSQISLNPGRRLALVLLLALLAANMPYARPVFAAGTFTVNTTNDTNATDTNPGNGSCITAAGNCSLRAALQEANASSGGTINFAIPTSDPNYNVAAGGYWTITPVTRMPTLSGGSITVNGISQPGGRTDGPKIFLNGSNLLSGNAFDINSANNTIQGMGMYGFKSNFSPFFGFGVYIDYQTAAGFGRTANNNTVTQSWIGVNPAGVGAGNEAYGVYVQGGTNTKITNNVISANKLAAIYLSGSNSTSYPNVIGTQILDNIIGTNPLGTAIITNGNPNQGISIQSYVQNTTISRNLISGIQGQDGSAIIAKGIGSGNLTISDNTIGTSKDGLTALANVFGINLSDHLNAVTISNNLISGNTSHGLNIHADANSVGQISILNNKIGLGADNRPLGNSGSGVAIYRANSNTIGINGSIVRGNTISANGAYGILIGFSNAQATDFANHVIAGNAIGTLPGGTSSNTNLLNQFSGIQIASGSNILIGGPNAADRNIITARSTQASIRLTGANVSGTTIQGNYLGLAADGNTALISPILSSAGYAVLVENGVLNTTITQNVISANNTGISAVSTSSPISIRANLIGTNASGASLRGNRQFGIWLINASNITAGGASAADGNTIAGNSTGVFVDGSSTGNTFEKNTVRNNTQYGFHFKGAAASINTVRANAVNTNGSSGSFDGIYIDAAQRILITQTTTQGNTGNGIGLANNANANKAAPTLNASLSLGAGGVALATGTAAGCGAGDCVIELFTSPTREDGEGPRYLGSTTTTAGGNFSINAQDCDRFLTATARDLNGNTSTFSSPMVDTVSGCTPAKPSLSAGTPASSSAQPNIVNAPGVVTYQHTLKNIGGLPGTFTVNLQSSKGWTVTTDFPSAGKLLNPNEEFTFNVSVTVPANAWGGPPADVTTVTATVGSFSDAKSNYTQLKQTFGVTIDTLSKQFTTTPTILDFTHTLVNTGNGIDTLGISAVNLTIPGSPTFSYPNGQQCANVNPGASCTLTVQVGLPSGSLGGTFKVTATAGGGASAEATDTAFTRSVVPQLSPATKDESAYPSEVVTFVHILKNVGTETGIFTITPPANSDGWTFQLLSSSSITIASRASEVITFTATLPAIDSPNTIAGLKKSFVLLVTSDAGATTSATDSVTVLLKPQFEFSAATSPVSANPLDTVTFVHTLKNTSNGNDSYTISVTPSAGLELVTVTPASPVAVARGATVQVIVKARVKAGTLASVDTEQLEVKAQSVSTPQPVEQAHVDQVTVLGKAVPALTVNPTSTGPLQPGTTVDLSYTLTNNGNEAGSFSAPVISVPGVPAGWLASTPQPACGSLDPGDSCNFTVTITVPANAYAGDNLVRASVDTSSAVTVIKIAAVPGVQLEADRQGSVGPGETVNYDHTLTNTGNVTTTFTLSKQLTNGWTASIPTSFEDVPPGASRIFTVEVTAPAVATAGDIGNLTMSASSVATPVATDSVTDETTITAVSRATLTPDTQTVYSPAGQVARFAPKLRNSGSTAIAYDIVVETAGWTSLVTPTQTLVLQPGDEISLDLTVAVPANTPADQNNLTTLRVREKDTAIDLAVGEYTATTAIQGSLLDPVLNKATVLPGTTHIYTHTLRNVGSTADTFLLSTIATNGWSVIVSPPSVFLQPDETRVVEVSVRVPAGLAAGVLDYSYVQVEALNTPQLNATGTEITTVKQYADMTLAPSRSSIVSPGQKLDIQHTLLNLSNAADSYTITAQSEHGWPVAITVPSSGSVRLQPKASYPVVVQVTVPTNMSEGTIDHITVIAESQFDPLVKRSVVHTLSYPVTTVPPPELNYFVWIPIIDAP